MASTKGYEERIALSPWDYGGPDHVNRAPHVAVVDADGLLVDADDVLREHLRIGRPYPAARDLADPLAPPTTSVPVVAGATLRAILVHPRVATARRVRTLGCTEIDGHAAGGRWLGQRPGLLLKFLVCRRFAVVHAQEIAEALWGHSGFASSGTVRQCVHELRDKLETGRGERSAQLVLTRQNGYALSPCIAVDADDFAVHVRRGIAALAAGRRELAIAHLREAAAMYRDDFLGDEPEADWAVSERERLRAHMIAALDALAGLYIGAGIAEAAEACLERLADMCPLDEAVQRRLLDMLVAAGRLSDAARRYDAYSERLWHRCLRDPAFTLAELGAATPIGARVTAA